MYFTLRICLTIFLVGIFFHAQPGNVFAKPKANILLICIDDLKPNIHCYGDKIAVTPNIDKLASAGMIFNKAYCNQAVCAPSRNSLMTGLRPQTLGIYDLGTNFRKSRPNAITLGQQLKQHGYKAQGLGKIYHQGHGNGDDSATWSVPHYKPAGGYASSETIANMKQRKQDARAAGKDLSKFKIRGPSIEKLDVKDDRYSDGKIALAAVERINEAAKHPDEPFFIAVGFLKPHLPFVAPQKYWDLYKRNQFSLPEVTTRPRGAPSYAGTSWGELKNYSDITADGNLSPEKVRELIHGYYACVSYTDAMIGKLLNALEKNHLSDDTIVILWGDHGWHLGDHGFWCKHTNYEQAARIPLIVKYPPIVPKGVSTNALVETVDIYPTICKLANIEVPAGLDGKHFVETLQNPTTPHRDHIIHVYPRAGFIGRAIRTHRYRMVEWKKTRSDFCI